MELLGQKEFLFLILEGTSPLLFSRVASNNFLQAEYMGCLSSKACQHMSSFVSLNNTHPHTWEEVMSPCGLDSLFPVISDVSHFFHLAAGHFFMFSLAKKTVYLHHLYIINLGFNLFFCY